MKKVILGIIIGVLVTSGIGVVAYTYNAKDIEFTPSDSSWNVNTVSDAINDLKSGTDEYKNKSYTTEGIQIYDNRITILDGGYYIDENNTVYVNITFKTNRTLTKNNSWLLFYNLPHKDMRFNMLDTERKYTFKYRNSIISQNDSIAYIDYSNTDIPADEIITLQFKY